MDDNDFGKDLSQDEIALEAKKSRDAMEEAVAEEAFIASGEEDSFDNPLVPVNKEIEKMALMGEEEPEDHTLDGAFGSGGLNPVGAPFNNEEAFMNEDEAEQTQKTAEEIELKKEELTMPSEPVAPEATPEPVPEPVSEPTPASEPAPTTPASAPVSGAAAPVAGEAPKKKKKTGLIILIIVLVLLVAGGVGAFLFYTAHEAPERQISDAITKLYEADAVQMSGTIEVKSVEQSADEDDDEYSFSMAPQFDSMTIKVDSTAKGASASGSGTLKMKSGDSEINITLSGAYIDTSGVYIKIDGIKKTLEESGLLEMMTGGSGDEMSSAVANAAMNAVIDEFEGKWLKIDASTFEGDTKTQESYNCATGAISKILGKDNKKAILDAYLKNPVVILDEGKEKESADGLTYFYVKTDSAKEKAFQKEVEGLPAMQELSKCSESSIKQDEEDADKEDETKKSKVTNTVKLGITGWSHELKAIKGTTSSESSKTSYDLKISYEDKAVSEPSDAKNVKDLGKGLQDKIADAVMNEPTFKPQLDMACSQYVEYGMYATEAECKEAFRKEIIDSFNVEEMFGDMGGGLMSLTSAKL